MLATGAVARRRSGGFFVFARFCRRDGEVFIPRVRKVAWRMLEGVSLLRNGRVACLRRDGGKLCGGLNIAAYVGHFLE